LRCRVRVDVSPAACRSSRRLTTMYGVWVQHTSLLCRGYLLLRINSPMAGYRITPVFFALA
jgi:hypothetical protein